MSEKINPENPSLPTNENGYLQPTISPQEKVEEKELVTNREKKEPHSRRRAQTAPRRDTLEEEQIPKMDLKEEDLLEQPTSIEKEALKEINTKGIGKEKNRLNKAKIKILKMKKVEKKQQKKLKSLSKEVKKLKAKNKKLKKAYKVAKKSSKRKK